MKNALWRMSIIMGMAACNVEFDRPGKEQKEKLKACSVEEGGSPSDKMLWIPEPPGEDPVNHPITNTDVYCPPAPGNCLGVITISDYQSSSELSTLIDQGDATLWFQDTADVYDVFPNDSLFNSHLSDLQNGKKKMLETANHYFCLVDSSFDEADTLWNPESVKLAYPYVPE